MTQYLAISPKECQGLAWHPPSDVSFMATQPLVPLHAGELAKAASSMPLALVREGREWKLVGVAGFQPNHNLFIKEGKWVGNYQPQALKTWPFVVINVGEKGIMALDRESGVLAASVDEPGAAPFFDSHGEPAPALQAVLAILKENHAKQQATQRALAALNTAGVITPWPENLITSLGMQVKGLHMINEQALAQLESDAFLTLRKAQALPIAYALNLSLQQTHLLTRLARLNPGSVAAPENLDELFGEGDDELTFDFDS
jgi:hypothetical protein|tara:strand:+ start:4138 stop:4914 length:777 start_codon:yes stop_codon:yes gene_type:complete